MRPGRLSMVASRSKIPAEAITRTVTRGEFYPKVPLRSWFTVMAIPRLDRGVDKFD
jgi:hypothetical protein